MNEIICEYIASRGLDMCFMEKKFEIKVVSFIEIIMISNTHIMISNTHPKWMIKLFYHKFNDVLCRYFIIFIQKKHCKSKYHLYETLESR